MNSSLSPALLLPLRLYAGYSLFRAGLSKAMSGWLSQPKLSSTISGWLSQGKPYSFYASFLRDFVLPHHQLFSFLVVGGELAVGLALFVGLFTRPAAFFGLVMVLSFLFGQGEPFGANVTCAFAMIMLTLLLASPGRVLGLDAALAGRVPRWLS